MGVLDFWGRFTAADIDNDGGLNSREFSHLCKLQVEGISDDEIRLVLSQVRGHFSRMFRHCPGVLITYWSSDTAILCHPQHRLTVIVQGSWTTPNF